MLICATVFETSVIFKAAKKTDFSISFYKISQNALETYLK